MKKIKIVVAIIAVIIAVGVIDTVAENVEPSRIIIACTFIFGFIWEVFIKSDYEEKRNQAAFSGKVSGFLAALAFTDVLPEHYRFAEEVNRFAQKEFARCNSLNAPPPLDDRLWYTRHNFVEYALLCIEMCLDNYELPDDLYEKISEFCKSNEIHAQRFDREIPHEWL